MGSVRALFLRNAIGATVLPMLALALFLLADVEHFGRRSLDRALMIAARAAGRLDAGRSPQELQAEVRRLGRALGVRLTVISASGRVLADSEADPATMENHADRPEVRQALLDGVGLAERSSATLHAGLRYLAIAQGEGAARRVYRAAAPLTELQRQARRAKLSLAAVAAAILAIALAFAVRASRGIVTSIEALADAAERFSAGQPRPVRVEGPEAIRRLAATFNEMIARIDAQMRRLDEAQAYLDTVIRQMPDGLLVLDPNGRVMRVNPAAERLLGVEARSVVGRPLLSLLLSYALDQETAAALRGEPGSAVCLRGPDGRDLRVVPAPLLVGGKPGGAVVIVQDLSALSRADAIRRDFVANVSHELRTPAAAIRAMVETLMLRASRQPALLETYGPRIVAECDRIGRLVQDLLLLAETEAGRLQMRPEPLDPQEVTDQLLDQLQPLAAAAGSRVEREAFAEAPVLADRFALEQCLRNLVDNALRHAPGSTVRLGSRVQNGEVILYVADDGPGIPAAELSRIFERFYRVDRARARAGEKTAPGGSGLGLAIVRHLIEAQGGRVWAESSPGRGSTFFLALPSARNGNADG